MRSYDHLCGLALALDTVGDRWSMLIVRELLVRSEARYTDLRNGLPGIATNLLADRLRDLESRGVVERRPPAPPVATPVFRLTDWGRQLRPIVSALALWARPLVASTRGTEEFRSRWLILPVEAMLHDSEPGGEPAVIELSTGDEPITIDIDAGRVSARVGAPARVPDLIISGPPRPILGLLSGSIDAQRAASMGVKLDGNTGLLARVTPRQLGYPPPRKM
jgi:DNA-binding HxlR family transcriptional regulator